LKSSTVKSKIPRPKQTANPKSEHTLKFDPGVSDFGFAVGPLMAYAPQRRRLENPNLKSAALLLEAGFEFRLSHFGLTYECGAGSPI
jgi:hypothetical protein